jgi:hypothetical protein
MPQSDLFPPFELFQIIRMRIERDPSGVLVARSADIPGRASFASDMYLREVEKLDPSREQLLAAE